MPWPDHLRPDLAQRILDSPLDLLVRHVCVPRLHTRHGLREDLLLDRALDELGEIPFLQPAPREERAQGYVGVLGDLDGPADELVGLGHDRLLCV
jgi:hypothetical protein